MAPMTDVVRARLWIAAVGLVVDAEHSATRGTGVDHVTAVILADAAIETALGIICMRAGKPLATDKFPELLSAATTRAKLRAGDRSEIDDIHKIRNAAVHQGAQVTSQEAFRAVAIGRTLLDLYVPRVLRQAGALGRGGGLGDAVAALVDDRPMAEPLRRAQRTVRSDPTKSLEASSEVLWWLEEFTLPTLPRNRQASDWRPRGWVPPEIDQQLSSLADYLSILHLEVRESREWVIPFALGLSPTEYSALQRALPSTEYTERGQFAHSWDEDDKPNANSARRAVDTVARIVVHLWSADLIAGGRDSDEDPAAWRA